MFFSRRDGAWLALFALQATVSGGAVGPPVRYEVHLEAAVHHEARIEVTFAGVEDERLEIWMSRSSPGRYALHEFAKNIYAVEATAGDGRPLGLERSSPHRWTVTGHDGTVRVRYTLYANRVDGTYSGIDHRHAHLNAPATFLWARGLESRPVRVRFHVPAGKDWQVSTQLEPLREPHAYAARNLQHFMDSPTEIGPLVRRSWSMGNGGATQIVRLDVHHEGTDGEVDVFAALARAIIEEEIPIFGEAPRFDHGEYTFIADYGSFAHGDGMEHRNSTILTSSRPFAGNFVSHLSTLAHEFLHVWNVERIRPRSLEPFDFTRANMSGELWFAEGFTSYYTDLVLRRARIISLEDYADRISGPIHAVITSPGRHLRSAVEMSQQAPFVDAAVSVDPVNHRNTYISYYTFGNAIGLGLDLTIRHRFPDLDLDDLMRAMWRIHGKSERPYTPADLETVLADLTDDAVFAGDFFARYIRGHEVVDYAALLKAAGLLLEDTTGGRASLGRTRLGYEEPGALLSEDPIQGSPLYRAGLTAGDRLLRLGGVDIDGESSVSEVLGNHVAGEVIPLVYRRGRGERTTGVTLGTSPVYRVRPVEQAGEEPTAAMRALRSSWLGRRAPPSASVAPPKTCPRCRRHHPFENTFCGIDGERLQVVPD